MKIYKDNFMTIEKYLKAGIISIIILVGFVIIFGILPNSINNYQQYFAFPPDEDSVRQKFLQSPEYRTFKERFPGHSTDFSMTRWDAQFSASATNLDTQNILVLRMSTNFNENRVFKSAQCDVLAIKSGNRYSADDVMVKPFLETTKCLESIK